MSYRKNRDKEIYNLKKVGGLFRKSQMIYGERGIIHSSPNMLCGNILSRLAKEEANFNAQITNGEVAE